ncbi:MAG: hypothetical protein M0020_01720 [Actinomycetota bacterium]|nr:hypothetical protein [Actinomycetota bacterium]
MPGAANGGPGLSTLLTMGATTAGCVAAGTGLGIYGDHVLNSSPACTLAGLGVGVVMAVGAVYAQIRKFF